MLRKVLSQLASFSTNSVNNSLIEHGNNGAKLMITLVLKIVKFLTRFFNNIENHIMEGSVPESIPKITPCNTNPKLLQVANVVSPINKIAVLKVKSETILPGTPTCKCSTKKQKLKPAAGAKDFTKAGLFCCKEGTPIAELFPANITKNYCSFINFHDKKCSKPNQACNFNHIGKWDKIHAGDQTKILKHCHSTQGKKVWLDADTFAKHRATVPKRICLSLRRLQSS
jgi:hypothetical protein